MSTPTKYEGHTPGPWAIKPTLGGKLVYEQKNPHGEASSYIAHIRKGEPGTSSFQIICNLDFGYGRKNQEADAALCADAPELLAENTRLREAAGKLVSLINKNGELGHGYTNADWIAALAIVEAALAAGKGEME